MAIRRITRKLRLARSRAACAVTIGSPAASRGSPNLSAVVTMERRSNPGPRGMSNRPLKGSID